MISEISPATPITDFTTIDILNVFQTKLTMRIYLVPSTCHIASLWFSSVPPGECQQSTLN